MVAPHWQANVRPTRSRCRCCWPRWWAGSGNAPPPRHRLPDLAQCPVRTIRLGTANGTCACQSSSRVSELLAIESSGMPDDVLPVARRRTLPLDSWSGGALLEIRISPQRARRAAEGRSRSFNVAAPHETGAASPDRKMALCQRSAEQIPSSSHRLTGRARLPGSPNPAIFWHGRVGRSGPARCVVVSRVLRRAMVLSSRGRGGAGRAGFGGITSERDPAFVRTRSMAYRWPGAAHSAGRRP